MSFELEVQIGGRRFRNAERGLRTFANSIEKRFDKFTPIAKKEIRELLDVVILALRRRHNTPWRAGQRLPDGESQGKLASRSGGLLRSLRRQVGGSGGSVFGTLFGSGLLNVHEDGKTIRARKAKFLAIPLPDALDSRGLPKKRGPRDYRDTFVRRTKRGNLVIFQKKAGGQLVPLFLLQKTSKIPKRLGLVKTMETAIPVFESRLFDKLHRELRGGR